jgi:hypothetical protein
VPFALLAAVGVSVGGELGCGSVEFASTGSTTTGGSTTGSGGSTTGSGGSAASCQELETQAEMQLTVALQQDEACATDDDCVWTGAGGGGACAAPCGMLTSTSGAAAAVTSAALACEPFVEAGCRAPILGCPIGPPSICSRATCTSFNVAVSPASTSGPTSLTTGVCAALSLVYSDGEKATAPHDLEIFLQAPVGTLFADAACTVPLATSITPLSSAPEASVTLPAGGTQVTFGLMPTGDGSIQVTVGDRETDDFLFTAQ